jgi:hypothetical protein
MRGFVALLVGVLALAMSVPVLAGAAKKPKPTLTIGASPKTITFARSSVISGQLGGSDSAAKTIRLEENPYPFKGFKQTATTQTDASGFYSFTGQPKLNTKYRVKSSTKPPATSSEVLVSVRIRVSVALSDTTPRAGRLVRFSGSASPEHDGNRVCVQRRSRSGSYRAVACTRLRDAGSARSSYSRRVRIRRDGIFRTFVFGDADHAAGKSRARKVNVH